MSWKDITDDQILEHQGSRENPYTAQYERILQKRQTDALMAVKDKLTGVMETVYRASQGLQEKADKLSYTISQASGALQEKSDELSAQYQRISESQGRQQRAVLWLTAIIGVATIAYTWITWESVRAMREANEIQKRLVEVQTADATRRSSAPGQPAGPPQPPHQ